MRLHRYAMLTFEVPVPRVETWGYTTSEGVDVAINNVQGADATRRPDDAGMTFVTPRKAPTSEPTQILLHAEIETRFDVVDSLQIRLPNEPREAAERALSEMASIIGVLGETQWTLTSPRPYLIVSAESEEEAAVVRATKRIILPGWKPAPPFHGQGLGRAIDLAHVLSDRLDGVTLLGAALRAGHGIPKLHELFRVLENGFGCAGGSLVGPLTSFLQSYPGWNLGYSRSEVRDWVVELRHPSTHADLTKSQRIAYDSDVERHLYRIEQAAYDVFFNKRSWNSSSTGRLMRWTFDAAVRADGSWIVGPAPIFRTSLVNDHFGTFPLTEAWQLNTDHLSEDWLAADWYFSEADRRALGMD
ncbi:hypothetical protein [Nocardioides acrostichi]|uniref:Uncharacterized protein n=1 Tax=Nocardioides acrostichi TaxID=2784339 RepID=A0A930Y601_9ACTN|nr:hypothetical protein [Nocardioides acrostichi]MBF4161795.1 hypothetical protein [Nocardioides acrostichi]